MKKDMNKIVLTEEQKKELADAIERKLNVSNTISIEELLAKEDKSSVKKE